MTLTTELTDSESPASRFLHDSLPTRDTIAAAWNEQLRELPPVLTRLDSGARPAVGGAIEWAIGLDLADAAPYADVFGMIPSEEATRVLRLAGLQSVGDDSPGAELSRWQRPASWTPPASAPGLLRDAWILSQYAGILRRLRNPDPEQWRQSYPRWLTMLGDQGPGRDVMEALETQWHAYVTRGHAAMAQLGRPRIIRPIFDDAFAIGDLVLGGTLIDIKTYIEPASSMSTFVDQLLGYVMCDAQDRFVIRSIGIYLTWQAKLLHLPLDTALSLASARKPFDLHAARQVFQQRIAPAVERSRFYKHGTNASDATTSNQRASP